MDVKRFRRARPLPLTAGTAAFTLAGSFNFYRFEVMMALSFASRLLCSVLFAALAVLPAAAEDVQELPPPVENALSALLSAAPQGKADPGPAALTPILDFVTANALPAAKVRPASRDEGSGVYYKETLGLPLRKLMSYTLDPAVPGEAIYPSSVRRNAWLPGSAILKDSAALLNAPLPPAAPLSTRGIEYEETTPDTSSGCYYSYKLDRLFVLMDYKGRAALFSISAMPGQSSVGLRGAIVGDDKNWTYVYTPEKGTNLAMLGWAETYLYGSASVSVFMESAPGSGKTEVHLFKWAKAGWKGSNVVKPSHITAGLRRFTSGLRQVTESPRCPSPQDIAARFAAFKGMDEAALRAQLQPLSAHLAAQDADPLDDKAFRAVLGDNAYAGTLKREDAIAELMKLYMRQALGMLPPANAQ